MIEPRATLQQSQNGQEIHVPPLTNTVLKFNLSGVASTVALPADMDPGALCRFACDENCYLRFDSSAVAATDQDTLMIKGVEPVQIPPGATHISVIWEGLGGPATLTLYQ
jgi:hypothetical protein